MIVRKPYAFLIKHFKKIHIFLFLLCTYIVYKTTQLYSFMKDFVEFGSYDYINEPISGYITFTSYLFIIMIVASTIAVLILLYKKKKPWKMYIVPIISYLVLFVIFIITSNFFATYIGGTDSTGPRLIRDTLLILLGTQYLTFLILAIRILGIDLNKFDFKSDEEYLELSEADQAEFEINIDIDKNSIKRFVKRFKRNAGYYVSEHKKVLLVLLTLILLFAGFKTYEYIFIINKSYKQGDVINTSGYQITINNSYYSSFDYKGDTISKESNFIVLDVSITNLDKKRKINFAQFHIMNGTHSYSPTAKTYGTQFIDLGKAYEDKTINKNEKYNTLLIYKVSKKLDMNKFVLYFQEVNNAKNTNHLRKIKLKLKDQTKIKENKELALMDDLKFYIGTKEHEVLFDDYMISDNFSYKKEVCGTTYCGYEDKQIAANAGQKILKISFASDDFDGKHMIDFLYRYGTINYIDSNDKKHSIEIRNALPTEQYYGKYAYIIIPAEVAEAKSVKIVMTVRDNRYTYKII